jgi:hypothetical protein
MKMEGEPTYYEPDVIPVPVMDEDVDPHGIIFQTHMEEVKSRAREIISMRKERNKMFARIWETLSDMSKEKISQEPDYEDFYRRDDPLDLWKAIKRTHLTANTGNLRKDKEDARHKYENIYLGATESLSKYYNRFQQTVQLYVGAGNVAPTQEDQAIHFLAMLDKQRYADFVSNMHSNVSTGALESYPTTVLDVYAKATRFRVDYMKRGVNNVGIDQRPPNPSAYM